MHLTPEGLPPGIPGMGDDIDGIIQQAPQPLLHSIYGYWENLRGCLKSLLPPRHDHKVVTPLLEKGGEMFDFKYLSFLLLDKEEYPDRSVGGRW